MSLWGTTDGTKPKFLTDEEKKLVFANSSGWVLEAGAESSKFTFVEILEHSAERKQFQNYLPGVKTS